MYVLLGLFDNVQDIPISTESSIDIHSIVFARAALQASIDRNSWQWPEHGEGIDITGLITLEVRDRDGNINHDVQWDDMLDYVIDFIRNPNNFSLRYKNSEEIPLWFGQSGMCCCGIHVFTSGMPTQEYFILMNTSQLDAIVINGVAFPVAY